MKKIIEIVVVAFLLSVNTVWGQKEHTENKTDQTLRGSGRVNPSTLGVEIDIPLGLYPGRGINVPIGLSYSSKVWRIEPTTSQPAVNNPENCISINVPKYSENAAAGWTTSMAVPYIEYMGEDNIFRYNGFPISYADLCDPSAPPDYSPNAYVRRISVHLPSGETHELRLDDTVMVYPYFSNCVDNDPNTPCDPNDPSLPGNWTGWYKAVDGSNLRFYEDRVNNTFFLQMPDGSRYDFVNTKTNLGSASIRKANKFTDRNGNFTTYHEPNPSYPNGYWTDTLGRIIAVPFGLSAPAAPNVQTYAMPGMTGTYKFNWKQLKGNTAAESAITDFNVALKYVTDRASSNPTQNPRPPGTYLFQSEFSAWVVGGGIDIFNPVVLAEIELPTGRKYKFTYDVHGRLERVYYPTGGEERFEYGYVASLSDTSGGDDISLQANFGAAKRQVYTNAGQGAPLEWNYSTQNDNLSFYKVITIAPDNTKTERFLHHNYGASNSLQGSFGYESALTGMAYDERAFSSTGQLMSKKLTSWTTSQMPLTGAYGSVVPQWHPRVWKEETVIYDQQGAGVSATKTFEYEGDLNQRETPMLQKKSSEYAFVTAGSPLPAAPARTSENVHLLYDSNYPQWVKDIYANKNIVGLATSTTVKDSAGTIVSRSEMKYDDGALSPEIGRANPTTAKTWDSTKGAVTDANAYLSTYAKFDAWGNRTEATDAKGNTTITEYDATHNAFPVKVKTPIADATGNTGSNTRFETSTSYNFITGLPITTTDVNGQTTTLEYDPVTLRPTRVVPPAGAGLVETIYHDEPNNTWVKNRAQVDSSNWAESITYLDGLGRAVKVEKVDAQGNVFVETEFDHAGRPKRVTNPYRQGEAKAWTTNVYDEASRLREVVTADGAKVVTDYGVSVSGVIGVTKQITDQAGKKRKGVTDALGRMVRVIEDPSGQNLSTDYVFDTLDNLRQTTQGAQNRYFMHDSLGRLLYAKQPEQETNTAFAATDSVTGNAQWSVKYQYDDNGNIVSTTDALGVTVTANYDNLNRLTFRNYSDVTPDVNFYYDGRGLGAIPAYSKGKTTRVASSVSETRYMSFDNLGKLLTHQQITDGQTYNTSYRYNSVGVLTGETYPSGREVNYDFNSDGEMSSIWGQMGPNARLYANGISYTSAGALERLRLGNGKWETAVYNNRLQVTKIGLGNSAADTSLMKLEYGYGTTDNNGSMRSQKITVPTVGSTPGFVADQTYTYDNLNRLESATENVAAQQIWKQSFLYDRFGNRRFNAAQTTTLPQSNNITNPLIDAATNRFANGQNYVYDKNGNLKQDAEGRQFFYDAENHQKEVKSNAGVSLGTYIYDGEGRRVKKVSAAETVIFVYDGLGQLVAEYSTQPAAQPQLNYLTADHLGSPRVITDQKGKVVTRKDYMAFGEETYSGLRAPSLGYNAPDTVRQGYTGYQQDEESGLEFAQARYYNTKHGRFTSTDPLMASANVKDPQTLNRYSYAMNSPYKFVDPLGLISSHTGACGNGCINSGPSGGIPSASGGEEEVEPPKEQQAEEPVTPPSAGGDEIPKPPNIVAVCEKCGSKAETKRKQKELQKILDKLVADNWPIIYGAVKSEVAKTRVPQSEVTEETNTDSSKVEGEISTDGPKIGGGKENSTSTKSERVKSLEKKLSANEEYLNNNAIAIQSAEGVVDNGPQFVAGLNERMMNYADKLLGQADQSPPLSGSLPIRRADPNMPLNPPRQWTPQQRIRGCIRSAQRSIYQ